MRTRNADDLLINWSIGGSILWVGAVVAFTLYWASEPLSAQFHPSTMSLSDVADFVAGDTSPLAFLWFFVTVWLQRQGLADAAAQARETEANTFKLALFDKRLRIRQQFEEAVHCFETGDEDAHRSGIRLLADAADTAEFLFGETIVAALRELLDKGHQARALDLEHDRLQRKASRTASDDQALQRTIDGRKEIATWMVSHLTPARLNEMFRPYLQMPET